MYLLELGGEDDAFAACEAASAAADVERIAPGLALARGLVPERVRGLAYTHRASDLVGTTDASVESATVLLEASIDGEQRDRQGTVAVRARDVHGSSGVSTGDAERALGQVLVDRGFAVDLDDPDHVLRAAFSAGTLESRVDSDVFEPGLEGSASPDARVEGSPLLEAGESQTSDEAVSVCALGWLASESVRDFGGRAPTTKPFFQPGSMDPLLARAVANVAGARPGVAVLDPMCGTGGILVEAGLVGADVIGTDAQAKMVRGARENLEHFLSGPSPVGVPSGDYHVGRGDATRLPMGDGAVDAVVFDAPYGRQSKIETHRLEDLVAGALGEARRVADRAVVVADRSWIDDARDAGWNLEAAFERRVHRSLTRYVLVLS